MLLLLFVLFCNYIRETDKTDILTKLIVYFLIETESKMDQRCHFLFKYMFPLNFLVLSAQV